MESNHLKDRMEACLFGQAIGDALGLGTEFMSKREIKKKYPDGLKYYNQIVDDYYRKRWQKGEWTDDTDMMICVMKGFDGHRFDTGKIACNFKEWYLSNPKDVGNLTSSILCMKEYVDKPLYISESVWNLNMRKAAANGALMRTCVVGLEHNDYIEDTETISRLTHFDPRCVGSCVIATSIIHNLVWNNRELSLDEIIAIGNRYDEEIEKWVRKAYESSIEDLNLEDVDTMGYTLRSLSAALWCYFHAKDFVEGLLKVVNEGGDADTNAAIACAILGAKFGLKSIPSYYIDNLYNYPEYKKMTDKFISLAIAEESV